MTTFLVSKGGAVVRAQASHLCGQGVKSQRGCHICGLSLSLVLSFASRSFSLGTPVFLSHQKPIFPNSNLTRNHYVDVLPLNHQYYYYY